MTTDLSKSGLNDSESQEKEPMHSYEAIIEAFHKSIDTIAESSRLETLFSGFVTNAIPGLRVEPQFFTVQGKLRKLFRIS